MFLLINKPPNITSHDVINKLRKITGQKRIGHAGTLDPFAQGLLIVAIGRSSTKTLNQLLKLDKTYQTTLQLGAVSDSYDKTGQIQKTSPARQPTRKNIEQTLKQFIGRQNQIPPIYSAKKINGQKAYQLARKNKPFKLKPQSIEIYNLKLKKIPAKNNQLEIEVSCSSGTYIRSLAHDIGQKLKTGAYLTKLTRTQIGSFKLKDAIKLNTLTKTNWQKYRPTGDPPSTHLNYVHRVSGGILQNITLPTKTKALAFGTFDLLHPGHKKFLSQAKQLADQLYVIIARDINVKKIKNKLPHHNENTRLQNVKNLNLTTEVMLGKTDWSNRYQLINRIKPNIIALGYDQKINRAELQSKLKKYGLNPTIIRLKAYQPDKYKTSKINKT